MRKYYLDTIRWSIIVLVLVEHVISIYSSCHVIMSFNAPGIEALDAIGYMIYPWFMPCLFVVAGICARYSLQKRSNKTFLKERVQKLLIPFISYMVLIGPFAAELFFRVNDMDNKLKALPRFVIGIIKALNGMGPSWFLLQLFILSLVLVVIRKIDKKETLIKLGEKVNLWELILFYIPVLGAAQILNVDYTFRNTLYLLLFLMGYFIFYREEIQAQLEKYGVIFLGLGLVIGVIQCYLSWGIAYQMAVNDWLVMLYAWVMILAVMGCYRRYFNTQNRLTTYMSEAGFGIYLFHYVPMIYTAYFLSSVCKLPVQLNYILVFLASLVSAIVLYELIRRIPILNSLFGLRRVKLNKFQNKCMNFQK